MGRSSIFIINIIITLNCFLLLMIYLIVFGTTASSVVQNISNNTTNFFVNKTFYVLLIGLVNIPLILKRAIKELKIASFLLFGSIILFVVILGFQLGTKGTYLNTDTNFDNYYAIKLDFKLITGISVIFTAYSFQ